MALTTLRRDCKMISSPMLISAKKTSSTPGDFSGFKAPLLVYSSSFFPFCSLLGCELREMSFSILLILCKYSILLLQTDKKCRPVFGCSFVQPACFCGLLVRCREFLEVAPFASLIAVSGLFCLAEEFSGFSSHSG